MQLSEKISALQKMIDESSSVVFFGGAGVSTESGIPDFRSVDGLYNQKYDYPPEQIISHSFFKSFPEEFYRFYRDKLLIDGVEPNIAHKKLAELEAAGKLKAVVTQNIDGLHQRAGSRTVYELHGSVLRNYCTKCGRFYDERFIKTSVPLPICECGGLVKPDVVLYEGGLDSDIMENSIKAIANADMLIIAGTSLVVYPAAGLVRYFRGRHLVIINRDSTPMDNSAELVINAKIGEVLSQIEVR